MCVCVCVCVCVHTNMCRAVLWLFAELQPYERPFAGTLERGAAASGESCCPVQHPCNSISKGKRKRKTTTPTPKTKPKPETESLGLDGWQCQHKAIRATSQGTLTTNANSQEHTDRQTDRQTDAQQKLFWHVHKIIKLSIFYRRSSSIMIPVSHVVLSTRVPVPVPGQSGPYMT